MHRIQVLITAVGKRQSRKGDRWFFGVGHSNYKYGSQGRPH